MSGAKFLDSRMLNQPKDPALAQWIQIIYVFVFQFQNISPKSYLYLFIDYNCCDEIHTLMTRIWRYFKGFGPIVTDVDEPSSG